jgi:hypothetical protein
MAAVSHYLDEYLDPVAEALSPEVARSILAVQPGAAVLARVAELAEKSNEGSLTDVEREEYRSLADAGTLVALLKAKARRFLARQSA